MKSEVSCIIIFNLIKLSEKKNNYTIHRNMIKYSNPSLVTQTMLCNNPRHIFLSAHAYCRTIMDIIRR